MACLPRPPEQLFVRRSEYTTSGALLHASFGATRRAVTVLGSRAAVGQGQAVLLVEDDEVLARALARILRSAGFRVATAGSLREARTLIAERFGSGEPGCAAALLDLQLPDGDGESLVDDLAALNPRPAVAVLSGKVDGNRAVRLLGRGVPTIPKPIEAPALIELVRRLCSGGPETDPLEAFGRAFGLSPKETEMLRQAALGFGGRALSKRLGCAPTTTRTHWRRIFEKTGEHSRLAVLAAVMRFTKLFRAGGSRRGEPEGGDE